MKHNDALPNNHFKKTAKRYKTWFNQPSKKLKRRIARKEKAARIFPAPLKKLRPIVRCPTVIHNIKQRLGKGFTAEECREAGIEYRKAMTLGISVDLRRRNMNKETFDENVERIKIYLSKIKIYDSKKEAKSAGVDQSMGVIMPLKRKNGIEMVKINEIEKYK